MSRKLAKINIDFEEEQEWFPKREKTWLEEYWRCINEGYIMLKGEKTPLIVGEELKKEVEKLINDLNDPRYTYDTTEADKREKFKEKVIRQTKSPFYGKPLKMMLHQKFFWEVIYSFKMADTGYRRFTKVLELVSRKAGKLLFANTNIPTPDGNKPIKDIHIGDYVFDVDGKPTKVINQSPIDNTHVCYELTFEDGEKIIAADTHLWAVQKKSTRATQRYVCKSNRKRLSEGKIDEYGYEVLETQDMINDFVRIRRDGKGKEYKYRVPMNKPVEYEEKELPIDPYLLGIWLGDGYCNGHILTLNGDDRHEIIENLKNNGVKIGRISKDKGINSYTVSFIHKEDSHKSSYYLNLLKELNLYGNKHIPEIYMKSSVEQRMELIKGLMDTDGHTTKRGEVEFTQSELHLELLKQISTILYSLGIKHKISYKKAKCNGMEHGAYILRFFVDKEHTCFKLKRKTERLKNKLSPRMSNKSIIDIREVPKMPCKCISVENERGLFLCGNNYTVTHNSTDIAANCNYDLFLGKGGVDICTASFDDRLAKLVWEETARMRQLIDTKDEVTRHNIVQIRNDIKNITVFRLSSKTKGKDGFNCDVAIIDEIHLDQNSDIHDALYQSTSVKDEPLLIMITTEGTVVDGFLDKELEYARSVLNDEIPDIHYLPILFTQDSETEVFQDRWSWCKSNPALIYGVKKWSFLDDIMLKAQHQKSTRVTMLCKDFNIKQNSQNAWLNYSDVEYEQSSLTLADFRGSYAIAGVDLSQTTDLSSVSIMLMRKGDDNKYYFNKYFTSETKLDTDKNAGAKYNEWKQKGFLEVHEGSEVKLSKVAEYFKWLADTYQIFCYKIGYDNRFAQDWLSVMEGYGYKTGKNQACELIMQNRYVLSTPMKMLEADLISRRVQGLNEMDKWCLMNVALDVDNKEMIMPVKMTTEGRIDGAAAMIICNAMHFRCANDYKVMVDNR